MKIAVCKLKSVSPYSQSKYVQIEKKPKELPDDYERRTWRERCYYTDDRYIFIPPMQFANSLKNAAKMLNLSIPGQGKAKYNKNFEAGVMVFEGLKLPVKVDDVDGEWVHVPSDGRRGGTTRVMKCFPLIHEWEGVVSYHIFDDIITKDVFEQVLRASGELVGIGRFRPQRWGYYGRFKVEWIKWYDKGDNIEKK